MWQVTSPRVIIFEVTKRVFLLHCFFSPLSIQCAIMRHFCFDTSNRSESTTQTVNRCSEVTAASPLFSVFLYCLLPRIISPIIHTHYTSILNSSQIHQCALFNSNPTTTYHIAFCYMHFTVTDRSTLVVLLAFLAGTNTLPQERGKVDFFY